MRDRTGGDFAPSSVGVFNHSNGVVLRAVFERLAVGGFNVRSQPAVKRDGFVRGHAEEVHFTRRG